PKDLDLRDLSSRIFTSDNFDVFFRKVPPELLLELWRQLPPDNGLGIQFKLLQSMSQATLLISTRLSAEGLSPALRARVSIEDLTENPFFRVRTHFERLHLYFIRGEDNDEIQNIATLCEESLKQGQNLISDVFYDL